MIGYRPGTAARRPWAPGDEIGPARRATFPAPRVLLLGSISIASLAALIRPEVDPDFWWHVRVGRWMVEHRRLPGHDLFTYTVAGHRWVDHEYATEVLMWLTYHRFGLTGVSLAFGFLTWTGLMLLLLACRPGRHPYPIVGLVLALIVVAGEPVWGPRPQVLTFTLCCLVLLCLRRYREGRERVVAWLPAVLWAWSNLHGSWPIGLLLIGLASLAEGARWLTQPSRPGGLRRAGVLAGVGAISALAVGINPNGPAIYAYPFQTVTSAVQRSLIQEWQSPDFHLAALRAFEIVILLVLAGLALGRPDGFEVLTVLAGLALALESVRNLPLFLALAAPVLTTTWGEAWRRLARFRSRPQGAALGSGVAAGVTAVALAVTTVATALAVQRALAAQPALIEQRFPVGAATWLVAHPGVGTRMFNEYAWGGYLVDRFYPDPRRQVFVFGEASLMGDRQLRRYADVVELKPGWQQVLKRSGVDYVVYESNSALAAALAADPTWRAVYRDRVAVIYVRSGQEGEGGERTR